MLFGHSIGMVAAENNNCKQSGILNKSKIANDLLSQSIIAVWPLTSTTLQIVSHGEPTRARPQWVEVVREGDIAALLVLGVHQIPIQQPKYRVGFAADVDNSVVMQETRVSVALSKALQSGSTYTFRAKGGHSFDWRYDDTCAYTPLIQYNQTAYITEARKKWAYISWWMGSAGGLGESSIPEYVYVLDSESKEKLSSLPVSTRRQYDGDVAGVVAEIDLTTIRTGKPVILQIPGVGVSGELRVADSEILAPVYQKLMFALTHNRFGFAVDQQWSDWPRTRDHIHPIAKSSNSDFLSFFDQASDRSTLLGFRGGHFDAGDFDIRPAHTVVAQLLMNTYESFPNAFYDGQHKSVDSHNGIPDILDEALWSLLAWVNLQEHDGSVRAGIESHRHPIGIYSPEQDKLPYWAYAPDPNTTARVSALFAHMSRLLKQFNKTQSELFSERAIRAYNWVVDNNAKPAWVLYAASELYALTGLPEYKLKVESLWNHFGPDGVFSYLALEHLSLSDYASEARVMPDYFMGYLLGEKPKPELVQQARQWLQIHADDAVNRLHDEQFSAHRSFRRNKNFGWGQATTQGRYLDPVFASLRLGGLDVEREKSYKDAVYIAADFVLGANPLGLSWITGTGQRAPKHPLHLQSLVVIEQGGTAIPGIPVFGPATGVPQHDWMQPALRAFNPPLNQHPPMWRYADIRTFPHVNEFTVWETLAPQIQLFGSILGLGGD